MRGVDRGLLGWLRRLDRRGADLGSLDTGCYVLAKAGLLDGHRSAVHWEALESFAEAFPKVEVVPNLFEIDRNRFSCSGGTAAIDLMLHLIELQHGHRLASAVSEQFIHDRIRDARPPAHGIARAARHRGPQAAARHRGDGVQYRGSAGGGTGGAVRRAVGAADRTAFRRHLKTTPARYYLELRLTRARALLLHTSLPVPEVAIACGFGSAAHFSRAYRTQYGKPPRPERAPDSGVI